MSVLHPLLVGFGMLAPMSLGAQPPSDTARLKELLYDRQSPTAQSTAALLLLQMHSVDADDVIRQALRQTDSPDAFCALAAAMRTSRDITFLPELFSGLSSSQAAVRQSTAETLGELADGTIVARIQVFLDDTRYDLPAKQAAIEALGRSRHKNAMPALLAQLSSSDDTLRRAAASALTELTGQEYGLDIVRWRTWWERHRDAADDKWLAERLAYQASRSRRLEGELDRARQQIVRLHQQLYTRLPTGDRLSHVQGLVEAEDASVRSLAVNWCTELLAGADTVGRRALTEALLRLSRDGSAEVQRAAVLALGRVKEPRACEQLRVLLREGPAPVRAAAARAMAQQAKGSGPEALADQRKIVPALQKALDDPELEVVVEAAESLGSLGVPEAGAVLTVLLRHPSQPVRQTAALALERVADVSSLDGLLAGLNDSAPNMRFSLVGAIGHAVGDGHGLPEQQRKQLLTRLEGVMVRDADPGVRSRAATVLGECGSIIVLPSLWKRVLSTEDARVQEKAWSAVVDIVARSGSIELVREWDRIIVETGQAQRHMQFLAEVALRWQKRDDLKAATISILEMLAQVQLDQGKWQAAVPVIRDLLARSSDNPGLERALQWLLITGQQALKEGKRSDTQHIVQEAQPFLTRCPTLAPEFEKLDKAAK